MKNYNLKLKIIVSCFIIALIFVMGVLMWGSAKDDSATTDEPVHILSGYLSLRNGDFRLNPEHPFLGKRLAALPLIFLKPTIDYQEKYFQVANDFYYDSWRETRTMAENFLYKVGNNAHQILLLTRSVPIIFALIFLIILFWTALRYYGLIAALFTAILYAFCPNIIAHARLANTDLWMTVFFFLSIISFAAYLQKPNWPKLILAGICFGLAQSVKFSAVTLYLIIPILYFVKYLLNGQKLIKLIKNFIFAYLVIIILGFLVVWANYDFSITKIPAYQVINDVNYYNRTLVKIEPVIKYLQPAQYWKGLTFVFSNAYGEQPAYLLGHLKFGGWWYYFPIAFLVKTPLPTIILLILSIILYIRWRRKLEFKDYVIITPVVVYMLISLTSKLNLGIRHLLPIYPFIYLWLGGFMAEWFNKTRNKVLPILITSILIIWYVVGTIRIYPHYLAYFNEIIGSKNGSSVLADSNIDWGQDLKRLSNWLNENQIKEPILLEYYWGGEAAPDYYQINWLKLKSNDASQKGYVAIGLSALQNPEFSWLKKYSPIANIGYSINIYKIE